MVEPGEIVEGIMIIVAGLSVYVALAVFVLGSLGII